MRPHRLVQTSGFDPVGHALLGPQFQMRNPLTCSALLFAESDLKDYQLCGRDQEGEFAIDWIASPVIACKNPGNRNAANARIIMPERKPAAGNTITWVLAHSGGEKSDIGTVSFDPKHPSLGL